MILIIAMKIMKVVFPLPSYKSSVGGCSHDKFLVQEVHEQHPTLFHRGRCKGPRLHIAQVTFSKLFLADTFLMQICFKYLLQIFSSNSFSSLSFTRGPLSSNFFFGSLSFRFSPKGLKGSAHCTDGSRVSSRNRVRVRVRVCPEPHISLVMRSKNSFGPRLHGTSC